ncbi:class I adenylate-forming enzyme family protein [Halosolutus halophilus]|uniref:class I adenylate-forming enzyme family protein n=1 Tax=Halosolutus halophilus TaxID=1552990 RepID=UPI0022350280|nr:long-chain fatty acid--CoA ligase [Halosolutus halophilus]
MDRNYNLGLDGGDGALDGTEGTVAFEALVESGDAAEPLPDHEVDPEQGLLVFYTSGTTGLLKGVVISHRAWIARGDNYVVDFDVQSGDCQLSWTPLFHIVSANWLPTIASVGGIYYPIDGFETARIVEILQEDGGIGWFVLLFGVVGQLLESMDEHNVDLNTFREIRNIGALVHLIDLKKVEQVTELFDMPFKNSYGAMEVSNVLSAANVVPFDVRPGPEELAKVESSWVDLKLIDEDWNEDEGHGELAVRRPVVCSGYFKNPEANRADFEDGWFRTGDIFEHNDDGTYSFVNRRKYLIKSGGENIYPAEIEDVLLENGLVEEAIVVRVPDEKWGEVPRAVVATHEPDELDAEDLLAAVEERFANYKLPHYVNVVTPDVLPRSETGKIVREDVQAWNLDPDERIREV